MSHRPKLYGVFAVAPGQKIQLHSWPITKKQAESLAGDKEQGLRSGFAKSRGWHSVTVRPLTKEEIEEQVIKAQTDFGGRGWHLGNLPPTMRQLLREHHRHGVSIRADIDSQIEELNTPFRIYKDGHSEGTIRRGDVWSNTYLKHQRELGNSVTINEKRKEVTIENPNKREAVGKEERMM